VEKSKLFGNEVGGTSWRKGPAETNLSIGLKLSRKDGWNPTYDYRKALANRKDEPRRRPKGQRSLGTASAGKCLKFVVRKKKNYPLGEKQEKLEETNESSYWRAPGGGERDFGQSRAPKKDQKLSPKDGGHGLALKVLGEGDARRSELLGAGESRGGG